MQTTFTPEQLKNPATQRSNEILRACACAAMEMPTEALADRQAVIAQSENYRETAKAERAFALLHGNDTFEKLVNPMELAT